MNNKQQNDYDLTFEESVSLKQKKRGFICLVTDGVLSISYLWINLLIELFIYLIVILLWVKTKNFYDTWYKSEVNSLYYLSPIVLQKKWYLNIL